MRMSVLFFLGEDLDEQMDKNTQQRQKENAEYKEAGRGCSEPPGEYWSWFLRFPISHMFSGVFGAVRGVRGLFRVGWIETSRGFHGHVRA